MAPSKPRENKTAEQLSSLPAHTSEKEKEISKEIELKAKFAEETHQYIREYIRLADQKAAFYFTGATAFLAYLSKQGAFALFSSPISQWKPTTYLASLSAIGLLGLALACIFVITPRLAGSKRGIIYFSAIAEYESSSDYSSDILNKNANDLINAKLCHGYDISRVCSRKYAHLLWGQWLGAAGAATGLFLIFLTHA